MREIFTIVLIIIGALIGAGFASGQEVYSFFYSYGPIGLIGIIITCILISLIIYKSLKIIYIYKIDNYDEFLKIFIKNKFITKIINIIINILLLVSFYIMIAGFGAYFEQEIEINKIIGSAFLATITAIIFSLNIKGIAKVSSIASLIIVIFLIFIGGINLYNLNSEIIIPTQKSGWLISSIIYCSYNMILLIPVLISYRKQITKFKNIKFIAILCCILMIIISLLIFMILTKIDIDIKKLEMPLVYAIRNFYPKYKIIYAIIILFSIFTTAISIGIGFIKNVAKNKKSYTHTVFFMCITSLIISNFGFSKLVNFIYPLFGYLGIIQLFLIVKKNYCK